MMTVVWLMLQRVSDTMSLGGHMDTTAPRMRPLSIRQAISTASTTAMSPSPGETRASTLRRDAVGSKKSMASANEAKRLVGLLCVSTVSSFCE